jgi:hypothetical protein
MRYHDIYIYICIYYIYISYVSFHDPQRQIDLTPNHPSGDLNGQFEITVFRSKQLNILQIQDVPTYQARAPEGLGFVLACFEYGG